MRADISACGLFCGACRRYKKGDCKGCHFNEKASWCKVRTCCQEHGWQSCAECTLVPLAECKSYNSFMAKIFKFVFRSDRHGCIERIGEVGYDKFAEEMRLADCYNRPVKK